MVFHISHKVMGKSVVAIEEFTVTQSMTEYSYELYKSLPQSIMPLQALFLNKPAIYKTNRKLDKSIYILVFAHISKFEIWIDKNSNSMCNVSMIYVPYFK